MDEATAKNLEQFQRNLIEHMQNPRNMGDLPDADAEGYCGSDCGDWVRFKLKLDSDKRIADARYLVYGCGSALASSSVLSEMVRGKSVDEASQISAEDVMLELGGLPEQKVHCNQMSFEAFRAALDSCRSATTN